MHCNCEKGNGRGVPPSCPAEDGVVGPQLPTSLQATVLQIRRETHFFSFATEQEPKTDFFPESLTAKETPQRRPDIIR